LIYFFRSLTKLKLTLLNFQLRLQMQLIWCTTTLSVVQAHFFYFVLEHNLVIQSAFAFIGCRYLPQRFRSSSTFKPTRHIRKKIDSRLDLLWHTTATCVLPSSPTRNMTSSSNSPHSKLAYWSFRRLTTTVDLLMNCKPTSEPARGS